MTATRRARACALLLMAMLLPVAGWSSTTVAQDPPGGDPSMPVRQSAEPDDDPNATGAVKPVEIAPGEAAVGSLDSAEDVDRVAIVLPGPAEVALTVTLKTDGMKVIVSGLLRKPHYTDSEETRWLHVRGKPGRIDLTLRPRTGRLGSWRLEVTAEPIVPGMDLEPNDLPADALPIAADGTPQLVRVSYEDDTDRLQLDLTERGIWHVTIAPAGEMQPRTDATVYVYAGESRSYSYKYAVDRIAPQFHFYPVLDPGRHSIYIRIDGQLGEGYTVTVRRHDTHVPADNEQAAHAAIDRATDWLIAQRVNAQKCDFPLAGLAMALAALVDGEVREPQREPRKQVIDALIASLRDALEPVTVENAWPRSDEAVAATRNIYEHTMATVALAEAVAAGHDAAREPCRAALRFILASQLLPGRCEAWGPVVAGRDVGGWRYKPDSKESDLSVSGWCVIALYAAAVADIDVPGMTDSVREAMNFVTRCRYDEGYSYRANSQVRSGIGNSIGALLNMLFRPATDLDATLADLDRNLCAGTECSHGSHNTPYYYWYYATRVNFLRGGYAWEAWRSVMIEQLLRRQNDDGTWDTIRGETGAGPRYATGLAVLILRLCLGHPPHYLRREVQGF
ncbi:MAG: hypothetical protein AB7K09_12665 [Planctomycetota bacterium]